MIEIEEAKMKKVSITLMLIFIMLLTTVTPCNAISKDNSDSKIEYEHYNNGSYAVVSTVVEEPESYRIALLSAQKTKTASRTYTYYNKNDKKAWTMTLKATFSYNGSKAKTISSSVSHTIYINGWKCTNKFAVKSGAATKATGTFRYGTLTKIKSIGLKCSKTGTILAVNY